MKSQDIVITEDKEKIGFDHFKSGKEKVIIIAPGFFNSKQFKLFQKIALDFTTFYDVIMFDFRGHGVSSGQFTWMARETNDLEVILDYATDYGYKSIGLLGFSLGAAIAIIVASKRSDMKSMVLISCPMSLWGIEYHFWEPEMFSDLVSNFKCNWQGKGARCDSMFHKKEKPIDCVKRIKNTNLFFIHGNKDWVIKHRHSEMLYNKAMVKKKIEIIDKGLHAERLFEQHPEKMKKLIIDWFSLTL